MTNKEKLQKKIAQIAAIDKWQKRLDRLKKRKIEPLSEAAFCRKHGISETYFSKMKAGHRVPKEATFNEIESAFVAEGV